MTNCNNCVHHSVCYKFIFSETDHANCLDYKEEIIGHWIPEKAGLFSPNVYKCSYCGNVLDFHGVNGGRGSANYCPNCNATMKGIFNE